MPGLEEEFPGIRRMILEHHLRYTFVRFGVPYVVSIVCFDGSVSRYKLPTCRAADQVAQRFLRALRVVGGKPRTLRPAKPLPVERPARVSRTFGYYGPGQLLSGTGFRGQGGRTDYTVYSQIRFPLEDAPAFAKSQVYQRRERAHVADPDDLPSCLNALARQFLRTPRLPGRPVPGRDRAPGPGHPSRAVQAPARHRNAARIVATSSPPATVSSCARHGRRRPISSSTRRTSTSGFAICT